MLWTVASLSGLAMKKNGLQISLGLDAFAGKSAASAERPSVIPDMGLQTRDKRRGEDE